MSAEAPPLLSIIVPTYNERDRLAELAAAFFAACSSEGLEAELVVVDDNSPDGTGALAEELARQRRMRVVHRPGKIGLGTAVIDGIEAATAPVVGVIDADLSHPPSVLPRMFAVMRQANVDVVVASRYIKGGGTRNWSLVRLLMSRLACLLARGLTPVRDATSGFFLIRRDLAQGVRISAGGFKICLELLVRGRPSTVVEVPYEFAQRTAGKSKMNVKEALGYLVQLRDLHRFRRAQPAITQAYHQLSAEELRQARG